MLGLLAVSLKHLVHMLDNLGIVRRAILGHRQLHLLKVPPQLADGLDDGAGARVRPESSGSKILHPGCEGTAVRAADEDPGSLFGSASSVQVERKDDVFGKVNEILDRLLQSEVLHVLSGEGVIRRALSPVAVLNDQGTGTEFLSSDTRKSHVGRVSLVAIQSALIRSHQDNGASRLVEFAVPGISLLKGAQLRVVMVNELVKEGVLRPSGVSLGEGLDGRNFGLARSHLQVHESGSSSREHKKLDDGSGGPHLDGFGLRGHLELKLSPSPLKEQRSRDASYIPLLPSIQLFNSGCSPQILEELLYSQGNITQVPA